MNEELKKELLEYGAKVEETIARFMGNEKLYEKFLFKMKEDQNYRKLLEHLDEGNYEEAFKDVHTMKGVAANLGLEPLGKPLSELTELLRNKTASEVEKSLVEVQRTELTEQYERFTALLAKFD